MTSLVDYQKFWAERTKQEEKERASLLEFLRRGAREATKILIKEFNAQKVYLVGSAASSAFFHKRSDVDLAVEGLAPQKYFSALAKICSVFRGSSRVDLIPLEDATPEMKKKIEEKGELLYG